MQVYQEHKLKLAKTKEVRVFPLTLGEHTLYGLENKKDQPELKLN